MKLILAFTLSLISIVHAGIEVGREAWVHADGKARCDGLASEINDWWTGDGDLETRVVPAEKVERATAILDQIHHPTPDELNQITNGLKTEFGDSYLKWISVAPGDCSQVRLTLVKTLLNTSSAIPALKETIDRTVKRALSARKYPTLLSLSIDALLIEFGLSRGLWTSNAAMKAKVTKIRSDLKVAAGRWRDQYGAAFAIFETDFHDASPESIERFKKLKQFRRIETGALAELKLVEGYSGKLRALLGRLDGESNRK